MSTRQIQAQLKTLVSKALEISKKCGRYVVALELFSGSGKFSKCSSKYGLGCIGLDILHGDSHDVLNPVVVKIIKGWLKSGLIALVWIGMPCNSCSRARHDINGGGA